MRRPIDSKSDTCTESVDVDVPEISVKVNAQYPGRSVALPRATIAARRWEGAAEVSRGHSRRSDESRRPEQKRRKGELDFR